ncbi:MAG: hypothetical protein R3290_03100 [Acidimicrobiia bacterium]|nr:hypothetical protein [Acidimicrobiia bacterium]
MAAHTDGGALLIRMPWRQISSPELPFVRMSFECVAFFGAGGFIEPCLDPGVEVAVEVGAHTDDDLFRVGLAMTRDLLIDFPRARRRRHEVARALHPRVGAGLR